MNIWWRLVQFGFRLLYQELAFTYDLVSNLVSFGQWKNWQKTALNFLPPPSDQPILDLAHGTGNLHLELIRTGYYQVYGLDLSPQMGRICRRKLHKSGLESAGLIRGSAYNLPFPDGSFAAIVCTFPTGFIFQPPVLTELHRTLQDQASLITVLGAEFTNRHPLTLGIDFLYRITGQRRQSKTDPIPYLNNFGFQARLHEVPCKMSKVMVLELKKTHYSQNSS
ncbi:class I SAM-dependent methyltransferase [Anaerolineales bacterium]